MRKSKPAIILEKVLIEDYAAEGKSLARVDGKVFTLDEIPELKKQEKHTIEVVVDRLSAKASSQQRLTDSVETALKLANGIVILEFVDEPTPNLDALKIYTATGADITDLVQISSLESGKLELRFSGIASGTYLLTLIESGKKAHFGRLIILK